MLHIIHKAHATWAHTNTCAHHIQKMRRTYMINAYVYGSVSRYLCCVSKIGPTNSYSVWTSTGMIGQGAQYESPTPYTSQRGWPSLGTWLDTSDSRPKRRDSNYNENRVRWINIWNRNMASAVSSTHYWGVRRPWLRHLSYQLTGWLASLDLHKPYTRRILNHRTASPHALYDVLVLGGGRD